MCFFLAPESPKINPYTGSTDVNEPLEKELACVAKGVPTPQITWYKDGKKINVTSCRQDDPRSRVCSNDVYSTREHWTKLFAESILTIKETKYSRDHGTYTCKAENQAGSDELVIMLNVQGKLPWLDKSCVWSDFPIRKEDFGSHLPHGQTWLKVFMVCLAVDWTLGFQNSFGQGKLKYKLPEDKQRFWYLSSTDM